MAQEGTRTGKKEYSPPQVIHSEKLEGRCTSCVKSDFTCNPGPIQS